MASSSSSSSGSMLSFAAVIESPSEPAHVAAGRIGYQLDQTCELGDSDGDLLLVAMPVVYALDATDGVTENALGMFAADTGTAQQ